MSTRGLRAWPWTLIERRAVDFSRKSQSATNAHALWGIVFLGGRDCVKGFLACLWELQIKFRIGGTSGDLGSHT